MTRTQRTIGIGAFVMLAVLGTGWALEKGYSTQRGVAVDEPATETDAINAPDSSQPMDERPAANDASPEYDRSDLILSQG
jgi:hypothetical protein